MGPVSVCDTLCSSILTDREHETGSVYIFLAVATLIGTPTAGAILKTVDEAHFTRLIVFSGALMAAGTLTLCAVAVVDSGCIRVGIRKR